MSNLNFYRRYRPTNFDEVVGQQVIVKTLKNAIANGQISHAYLFNGPRGTGKTSIAKIFSRAVNNIEKATDHPDIWEMDAASNNGVDEIRRVIENTKYLPIESKYKVYIIDEVHMLSKGAFNALLKTLEEPPQHVIFILATTEINKVPITIVSRCQRYDFSRISHSEICEQIKFILNKENIKYEPKAVEKIAYLGEGSLRDSLSLLQKVVTFSGEVTMSKTNQALNIPDDSYIQKLANHLISGESKEAVLLFEDLYQNGIDERVLVQELATYFRDLIISRDNPLLFDVLLKLSDLSTRLIGSYNTRLTIEVALIQIAKYFAKKELKVTPMIKESVEQKPPVIKEEVVDTPETNLESEISPPPEVELEQEVQVEAISPPQEETTNDVLEGGVVLMDILSCATKEEKVELAARIQEIHEELKAQGKNGLANFYGKCHIQVGSKYGCVLSLDDDIFEIFKSRKPEIDNLIKQKYNPNYAIWIMPRSEWLNSVDDYRMKARSYKKNNPYQTARAIFGNGVEIKKI